MRLRVGQFTTSVLFCLAVSLCMSSLRAQVAVEWLADGRPLWADLGRSLIKWCWVIFVVERAGSAVQDWFRPRSKAISNVWLAGIDRVAVVCAAGLPRFIFVDPLGGAPFSLWYGALLLVVDGFLHLLDGYNARARQAFWMVAFVFLIPWGLPSVTTLWPDQMT
jgi:hypothetical protein